MDILAHNVPQELKALRQWVAWKEVMRDGRMTKPPFRLDGTPGDSTDPDAWASFQDALEAYQHGSHGFEGVGFTFSVYDPFAGVDLDHCRNPETGEIAAWAWEIIHALSSYTEISPSGEGVHVIVKGRLLGERHRTGNIELYDKERYFTCTGHLVEGTSATIERRQEQLTAFYNATFPKEAKLALAPQPFSLDDATLLQKAFAASNGEAVRRLFEGNMSAYPSPSEADAALASHLWYWSGGDAEQVKRLLLQSGLRRDKMERPDYLDRTIKLVTGGPIYSPTPALPDPPDRERPVISTNGRHMRDITADSMAALTAANKDKPWLFARGTAIAQLSIGSHGAEAHILSLDALRGVLDRIADFVSIDGNGNEKPQRPPLDVVRDVLALKSSPLPPLNLLAEAPLFLLDGTLLSSPGYHRESGIYLHMDGLASVIHTNMEIDEAVNIITVELLGEFPFTDDGSLAHAVALTLQPFVRMLISGPTPLYLVDAPARGTGKGLLVETTGIIPTGRTPEVMAMAYGEEELEKRITSILLAGAQHILLDNVRSLKSSPLEAVLTNTLWRGRRLGHSEMVSAPNLATWVATGNNVSISDEMVRRLVPIRLDAQMERPEERTGWRHPHLVAWTKEHRSLLVSACISIVQAWLDAGMPKGTETMGRFESWAEIMGGILSVSGIKGFLSNRDRLYTIADSETEEWRTVCTAWWDAFEDRAITASDLFEVLKEKHLLLDLWGGRSALAGQQRIGHTLAEQRDRVFGPYIVKGAGRDGHTSSAAYRLVRVSGSLQNHRNPANPAPSQKAVDTQTVDSVVSLVSEPPPPQSCDQIPFAQGHAHAFSLVHCQAHGKLCVRCACGEHHAGV